MRARIFAAMVCLLVPGPLVLAQQGDSKKPVADDVGSLRKQVEALKRENQLLRQRAEEQAERAARAQADAKAARARAQVAQVEAERQRALADLQRQRAEENFRKARRAVDEMFRRLADEKLDPGPDKVRKELLERALKFYKELLPEKDDKGQDKKVPDEGDEKAAEAGRALQRMAEEHRKAGKVAEAQAAYRKAIALQQKLARDFPNIPSYRFDLAGSHLGLADVFRQTGRLKEAEAGIREAVALLERLVAEFPAVGPYRQELARAYEQLSQVMRATGRANEAEALLRRAEQIRKATEKGQK